MKNTGFLSYLFVFLFSVLVGFFVGRKTIPEKEVIKYIPGETIRDTLFFPEPVFEIVHDTIILIERDTLLTLIDWNTERLYTWQPINDNRGILDISTTVQYNRVQEFSFSFAPIHKEITIYRAPVWQPFVSASYSTFKIMGIGGGAFYNNIGLEYQWQYGNNRSGHQIGLKWKF